MNSAHEKRLKELASELARDIKTGEDLSCKNQDLIVQTTVFSRNLAPARSDENSIKTVMKTKNLLFTIAFGQ